MPNPKRPFLHPRFLPLLILLFLAVLFSLFLPDFFRQVILAPILSRVATLYGIYRSFPQNVMWGFLVFAAFVMMLYATRPQLNKSEEPFEELFNPSRFHQLVRMSQNATKGQHAQWQLAHEIQRLVLEMMQLESTETPETLRQRIETGELPVPSEIVTLLDVCASLPNYRSFLEARDAQPNRRIPQLAVLNLEATVAALVRWRQTNQEGV
ncbi:hypothetical protein [Candidatus Leptofilum sp.]|uniref:hypothetical protein n=1 Tax=Candidatus Leptofilum sp. TaxID=3241576 RepID=UPI003B5A75D5